MYVMMREGSVAKDVKALLPLVNERNARRFLLHRWQASRWPCEWGEHRPQYSNCNQRRSRSASCHTYRYVECSRMLLSNGQRRGGTRIPCWLSFLEELERFTIKNVFKDGIKIDGNTSKSLPLQIPDLVLDSVKIAHLTNNDLHIKIDSGEPANIIEIIPNSLVTKHICEKVSTKEGRFIPNTEQDHLKLAVIERHRHTGNVGLGIVKGFQMKDGAIASTVAHDSHNIVTVGTNDEDMLVAVRALERMQGGLIVVKKEKLQPNCLCRFQAWWPVCLLIK